MRIMMVAQRFPGLAVSHPRLVAARERVAPRLATAHALSGKNRITPALHIFDGHAR